MHCVPFFLHNFIITLRRQCIVWQVDICYGTIHEEYGPLLSPGCHVACQSTIGVSTSKWLWHLWATCQVLMPCNYPSFNPQSFMHGYKNIRWIFSNLWRRTLFFLPHTEFISFTNGIITFKFRVLQALNSRPTKYYIWCIYNTTKYWLWRQNSFVLLRYGWYILVYGLNILIVSKTIGYLLFPPVGTEI